MHHTNRRKFWVVLRVIREGDKTMVSFLRYQFPALVWAALIFASSAMPSEFFSRFNADDPRVPKVVHVLFFFFLCLFLYRAFRYQHPSPFLERWSVPASILICLAFGTLDEVHQMYVATRHPRITDILLDLSGATLMAITIWLWNRLQSPRRERVPS
jgi:VanZ family protein